jgi:hypothetical protein
VELHEALGAEVDAWRTDGYPSDVSAVAELLEFPAEGVTAGGSDHVMVTIDEFLSPAIVERLSTQEGVLTPHFTDWRAIVDSVFIDAAYDGDVFAVVLADIPERRRDLVDGSYSVIRPAGTTCPVAVRITDMLGEEVLVVENRAA